jgi:hypothetical protein
MGLSEALSGLFPYVCAIYIFDSIAYLRPGWASLTISFGRPSIGLGTGLMLLGLVPWRRTYILGYSGFLPSGRSAFFLYQDSGVGPLYRASDYREVRYDKMGAVEASGQNLLLNSERSAYFPSAMLAKMTAALLRRLSGAGPDERLSMVSEYLGLRFDPASLRDRRRLLYRPMLIISLLSASGFVLLFMVLPLALYTGLGQYIGLGRVLISFAVVAAITLGLSAYYFHTKFSRSALRTLIFMLPFLLLPISAPLMAAALRRQAYAEFDLLGVASLLMKEEDLRAAALGEYRKLSISIEAMGEALGEATGDAAFSEALSLRRDALMGFLEQRGISLEGAKGLPERNDHIAEAYCPSCHTEYRTAEGICIDCGIRLKRFPQG